MANRSHVTGSRKVISQIENPTPTSGTTGIPGQRNVRGRSGCL